MFGLKSHMQQEVEYAERLRRKAARNYQIGRINELEDENRMLRVRESTLQYRTSVDSYGDWTVAVAPGSGLESLMQTCDLVSSSINTLANYIAKCRPIIADADNLEVQISRGDAMLSMLQRPNDEHTWQQWLLATIGDLVVWGVSYSRLFRNENGAVNGMLWMPHEKVHRYVVRNTLQHYQFSGANGMENIPLTDVFRVQRGISRRAAFLGISPLENLAAEIVTDQEAAKAVAQVLKNGIITGLILSPQSEQPGLGSESETDDMLRRLSHDFGGAGRGSVYVANEGLNVDYLFPDFNKMGLATIRAIPEERIMTALGLNSAFMNLASGVESTRVGRTLEEYSRLAWESGIQPFKNILESEITIRLMPHFVTYGRYQFVLDSSFVQPQRSDLTVLKELKVDGTITQNELRRFMGLPGVEGGDGFNAGGNNNERDD